MEQTMIKVTINGETREYPKMTPYSEIVKDYEGETEYPVILVTENAENFTRSCGMTVPWDL